MVKANKAQREALKRVFFRINADARRNGTPTTTYRDFRYTVRPGCGCIMVPFAGMWLGIEPDGYTHS